MMCHYVQLCIMQKDKALHALSSIPSHLWLEIPGFMLGAFLSASEIKLVGEDWVKNMACIGLLKYIHTSEIWLLYRTQSMNIAHRTYQTLWLCSLRAGESHEMRGISKFPRSAFPQDTAVQSHSCAGCGSRAGFWCSPAVLNYRDTAHRVAFLCCFQSHSFIITAGTVFM